MSGYAGGDKETAAYEQVGTGRTGHAESVEVTFDPHVVSYGTILQIYFSVAHNPTELNYQGPDSGSQYRSEIFTESDEQKRVAEAYIAQLAAAKAFNAPIVTRVEALRGFYPAEAYHQNYATLNPDSAYIAYNDAPKVENLGSCSPARSGRSRSWSPSPAAIELTELTVTAHFLNALTSAKPARLRLSPLCRPTAPSTHGG